MVKIMPLHKDPGSVPSTHPGGSQSSVTPAPEELMPVASAGTYTLHTLHTLSLSLTHTHKHHTHTHEFLINYNFNIISK